MNNYNFSTLNDKEFELIAKDLLNAKFNLQLQDFKVGKDKGRDLRFSTKDNNNSIVVQAKHYLGSEFAQLKHTLLKMELGKIKILKPDRYIVATSLPLSATQKDELKDGLSPFVLTSNDIIGQEDLNGYLGEFNEIEKKYFKLWFSSRHVFESVVNNAVEGRTKYMMEKIREKIPFYVITKKLDDANKILQKEKLLLITGQPGIGKTTLAEIILFERAKNGHKIYKVENIKEAEDVISINNEEKQLFYFDDFLGANYFEIVNAHKTETQLTSFVERVKNTPNKYLILTTRTVILNHAIDRYEKISQSKLANQQFEIKLTDYSKYEKALILYNHLYFRGVRADLYDSILHEKFYKTIIQHKNYTPRIIEFITDKAKIEKLTPQTYLQFIFNNLNNPKDIWHYSFNSQIGYLDRCFLLTLFTFENSSFETQLFSAYESRLEYEKTEHNQIITANQFNESVRILLNGFISSNLYDTKPPVREFVFINPSLTDFLIGYVSDSFPERKSIMSSLLYVEQLNRFNPEKTLIPLEKELQTIIRNRIANDKIKIYEEGSKNFTKNKGHAILLELLCKYCRDVNVDTMLLENFKQITFTESWGNILQRIEYFLLNFGDAPQTFNFIKENFIKIIEKMMHSISDADNAKQVPILFEKYQQNYDAYTESDNGFNELIRVIKSVLQSNEDSLKDEHEDSIKNIDEVSGLYDEIYSLEGELKYDLFPNISFDYDFGIEMDTNDWGNKIEKNKKEAGEDDGFMDYPDYESLRPVNNIIKTTGFESHFSEDDSIDDLFERQE
jgi:energy-coupling factor transporter ATP-binding protein EcfA2